MLKQAVLFLSAPTERERLQKLFGGLQGNNAKPSTILAEMRRLLGTANIDESLLRELGLQRLLEHTQAILMTAKFNPLTELTQMADAVAERLALPPTVSAATIDHFDVPKKVTPTCGRKLQPYRLISDSGPLADG